jgi:hypothetical protein
MKMHLRALATIALAASTLTLGSCSVFVAGTKAVTDGATYVFTPGNYVHSNDPWGTDMYSSETNKKMAAEYNARGQSFKNDMTEVYDGLNKWLFNYDKNDPYIH